MSKNWAIGILAVALVVVGYFWYAGSVAQRRINNDLRAARNRIASLENKTTRPAGTTPAAPAEESKGGTQKDPAGEKGCLGCHPPTPTAAGKDYSVTAELKRISGHPTVATASTEAPKVCVKCHTPSGKPVASLAKVLHKPHLTGSIYTKEFDTNCIGCHGLKNGTPYVKGLEATT